MSDAIELFDRFIVQHADPSLHGHLLDSDDNDGEYVRRAIRELVARVRELEAERDTNLPRIAAWMSDARRSFEAIEQYAQAWINSGTHPGIGHGILDRIDERFRTRPSAEKKA